MMNIHNRRLFKTQVADVASSNTRPKLKIWPAGMLAILFSIPFAALALSETHRLKPAATSQLPTPDWSQQPSGEVKVDNSHPLAPSVDSSSENRANGTNNSDANLEVNVNGEQIKVPDNGSVHKVITDENGSTQTVIDIKSNESNTSTSTRQSVKSEIKSTGGGNTSITVESSNR